MRHSIAIFVVSGLLLLFIGGDLMAQMITASAQKPLSRRELRQQDRQECTKQVGRTHANLFLQCLADRRIARKLAAKRK